MNAEEKLERIKEYVKHLETRVELIGAPKTLRENERLLNLRRTISELKDILAGKPRDLPISLKGTPNQPIW